VSDPLSLASPRHEGEFNACNVRALFSPSVRGRAAEGGRGSLTCHLDFGSWATRPTNELRSGERIFRFTTAFSRGYTLSPLRG
jgi:hypothetical protein